MNTTRESIEEHAQLVRAWLRVMATSRLVRVLARHDEGVAYRKTHSGAHEFVLLHELVEHGPPPMLLTKIFESLVANELDARIPAQEHVLPARTPGLCVCGHTESSHDAAGMSAAELETGLVAREQNAVHCYLARDGVVVRVHRERTFSADEWVDGTGADLDSAVRDLFRKLDETRGLR